MEFLDFLKYVESLKLYRQERVVRWQTRDFMFASNDSSHQLYVTQLIVLLSDLFKIPDKHTLNAIKYGCCHDYVESTEHSLGDINYALKQANPELKEIVKKQERIAMSTVESFYNAMLQCETDTIAHNLVDLADALEALLYVRREVNFNKKDEEWRQIELELMPRVLALWKTLSVCCNNNKSKKE